MENELLRNVTAKTRKARVVVGRDHNGDDVVLNYRLDFWFDLQHAILELGADYVLGLVNADIAKVEKTMAQQLLALDLRMRRENS